MLLFEVKEITPDISGYSCPGSWLNAVFEVCFLVDGWTHRIYVGPGTMRCCGMGQLQRMGEIIHLSENLQQEVYLFLKKSFGPTDKDHGRISGYKHNQLFCTHADGVLEQYPIFMSVFNVKKEMTWQSASEPGHRTALYSINFV